MENIIIGYREGAHLISPAEILFLKAKGSYCIIKLISGKEIKVAKNLKYIQGKLLSENFFLKVHRSCIINKNYIMGIVKSNDLKHRDYIKMKNGDLILLPLGATKVILKEFSYALEPNPVQEVINNVMSFSPSERLIIIHQILHSIPEKEDKLSNMGTGQFKQHPLPQLSSVFKWTNTLTNNFIYSS